MNPRKSRPAIVKRLPECDPSPSHGDLCFNAIVRWTAAKQKAVAWRGDDVAKSNKFGLYDMNMIDDRNERPLTIAFATIVTIGCWGLGWFSCRLTSMPSPIKWRKAQRRSLGRSTSDRPDAVAH
jgi:hypothetical protein